MELSDKELLQFAIDSGMIDANTIRKQIEMNERKKFIEMHEYETWQGKNWLRNYARYDIQALLLLWLQKT